MAWAMQKTTRLNFGAKMLASALKRCCLCSSSSLMLRVGPAPSPSRDASNAPSFAFVTIG
jgi:hypothetical protein